MRAVADDVDSKRQQERYSGRQRIDQRELGRRACGQAQQALTVQRLRQSGRDDVARRDAEHARERAGADAVHQRVQRRVHAGRDEWPQIRTVRHDRFADGVAVERVRGHEQGDGGAGRATQLDLEFVERLGMGDRAVRRGADTIDAQTRNLCVKGSEHRREGADREQRDFEHGGSPGWR
ncbi:MAG: hypothetical protein IPH13_18095 [Planctomycetes bacterium]|nr:hypothetical protein [Planctomycetota bacterium]